MADEGRTLVVKNLRSLLFVDTTTGKIKQTLNLPTVPDSKVGFSVVGLLVQDSVEQLRPMALAGVVGFKCFLGRSTGDIRPPDDGRLLEGLRIIADLGLRSIRLLTNHPRKIAGLEAYGIDIVDQVAV